MTFHARKVAAGAWRAAGGLAGQGGLRGLAAATGKAFLASAAKALTRVRGLAANAGPRLSVLPKRLLYAIKGKKIPTVVFSRSRGPGIAANFDHAVANGAPTLLSRASSATIKANRRAALMGVPRRRPPGMSWDEYPFASSLQGGGVVGKTVFRRLVPRAEQSYQGGVLGPFFTGNNIQVGDLFRVVFAP